MFIAKIVSSQLFSLPNDSHVAVSASDDDDGSGPVYLVFLNYRARQLWPGSLTSSLIVYLVCLFMRQKAKEWKQMLSSSIPSLEDLCSTCIR